MCTLYTMVLVALLRYMKVYKMCWFCTLVHYGGGVGLVHHVGLVNLCARCAGGCAQIVLMVVQGTIVVLLRLCHGCDYHVGVLVLCSYVQGTIVVLLRLYHGGSAQASLE